MSGRRNLEDEFDEDEFENENFDDLDEDSEFEENDEELFDFELKERWEARKREEERAVNDMDRQYPGIAKYGSRARKIIKRYEERTQDYESDEIERALSSIPKEIGSRVLSKIEQYVAQDESDSIGRYEEENEVSGLKRKVNGLLMLAQTQDLQDETLFDFVTQQIEPSEDEKKYVAIAKIASSVSSSKQNPRITDHLKAFLMSVSADNAANPEELFSRLVNVPYMTDLTLATKGRVNKVPKHIGDLLENEAERDKYIQTLVEWPASIHLSAERFAASIQDPAYKAFVKNWVGESARPERVEFFDALYQKYGYEGLVKLGKPLLKAILTKGKGNKKLQDKLREEGIAKIYESVPSSNQSPPAWIFRLRQRIESAEPERVLATIEDGVVQLGRAGKEKELRSRYAELVRKVKKTTPVARGDYTSGDIIITLDEDLLRAMQYHDGKKTRMLESMGKDLKKVNTTFRESGLSSYVVVGLYDAGLNNDQIRELAASIPEEDRNYLHNMPLVSGGRGILFWLAKRRLNADDINYTKTLGADGVGWEEFSAFDNVARAVDDPRTYFSSLSLEQRLLFQSEIKQEVIREVVEVVDPKSLKDYKRLANLTDGKINGVLRIGRKNIDFSRFNGHEDVFRMLDGGWAQEDAKTIARVILDSPSDEVASKYCDALKSLSPYANSTSNRWSGRREPSPRYGPIATILKDSSEAELEVYGKIGTVYTKSSSWGSTRERIGFDKLQEVVKKTAELVETTPGLRERTDSFVGHIRNYTSTQERLDDLQKLEDIARATVSATPEESELLADIGGRHVGFTFTDQNLQKVRKIGELGSKLESLKGMSSLVRSDDQLSTVLDYAVNNTPGILATAYAGLKNGFSNDDEFYGTLTISRDEELSQKVQSINQGYRQTFLKFAGSVSSPDRLRALPESHFCLAAQAYEFAKQHNMGDAFFDGLNGSLQEGTVDQWSNAIIKHFRDESKGGDVYRQMSEKRLVAEGVA